MIPPRRARRLSTVSFALISKMNPSELTIPNVSFRCDQKSGLVFLVEELALVLTDAMNVVFEHLSVMRLRSERPQMPADSIKTHLIRLDATPFPRPKPLAPLPRPCWGASPLPPTVFVPARRANAPVCADIADAFGGMMNMNGADLCVVIAKLKQKRSSEHGVSRLSRRARETRKWGF